MRPQDRVGLGENLAAKVADAFAERGHDQDLSDGRARPSRGRVDPDEGDKEHRGRRGRVRVQSRARPGIVRTPKKAARSRAGTGSLSARTDGVLALVSNETATNPEVNPKSSPKTVL